MRSYLIKRFKISVQLKINVSTIRRVGMKCGILRLLLCECIYMAKLFYPEKFESLDVEAECNEVLKEFYGADGLYDWMLENCGDYYTWK